MDRLTIVLMSLITGPCIAGAVVILAFVLGIYSWWAFAVAAIVGAIAAWPTGWLLSRRIKRDDPFWDARRNRRKPLTS